MVKQTLKCKMCLLGLQSADLNSISPKHSKGRQTDCKRYYQMVFMKM